MFFSKLWTIVFVLWIYVSVVDTTITEYGSSACYLSGECGLHWLTCPPGHKIALKGATHGFKPYSTMCFQEGPGVDCLSLNTSICCFEEPERDCILAYREQHLMRMFERCSGQASCKIAPISVRDACYSMSESEPATFSKLTYGCIKDNTIANFCNRDVMYGSTLSANFKPNGLSMLYDKNCYCRIESASTNAVSVQVYALDVRFKRSTSNTCSELAIVKGHETHGTVASPKLPGEGFIHSFLPLLNLTTPIVTRLMLSKYALPAAVWIQFKASSGSLRLKCGPDEDRSPPACMTEYVAGVPAPADFTPDPSTQPKKTSTVVDVLLGVMQVLFDERTPAVGGAIFGISSVVLMMLCAFIMYRRRHIKKIKKVKNTAILHKAPKIPVKIGLSRSRSIKIGGLGRVKHRNGDDRDEAGSDSSTKSSPTTSPIVQKRPLPALPQQDILDGNLPPNIPNDANIIIVSRPSRNASVRSSCTCSSRGQPTSATRPPDVVLDSRAALQNAWQELNAFCGNNCCQHNVHNNRVNACCQGDWNHGHPSFNNAHHLHGNMIDHHDNQQRTARVNSIASHAGNVTQVYGNALPEVSRVPVLPINKKNRRKLGISLEQTSPLYIVHNTKKLKDTANTSANRVWNWLKKCKSATKMFSDNMNEDGPKDNDKSDIGIEDDVMITHEGLRSVLPLPAVSTLPGLLPKRALLPPNRRNNSFPSSSPAARELILAVPRSSSIPSTSPPKPPPRPPHRPPRTSIRAARPPRTSIRAALKTMSDVYTQVVNPPMKKIKPRVPRRRTQECATQVYQDVPSGQQDVATRRHDVTTIQNDVTPRQNDVTTRQHDVTTIQNDVTPRQNDVTTGQNDGTPRQNDVTTRQNDVTTRQNDVTIRRHDDTTRGHDATTMQQDIPPAVIDAIARGESDSSNYANDYIMPVHASNRMSERRTDTSPSYAEVSDDNYSDGITVLHTMTLREQQQEDEESVSKFDRIRSVLWQNLMRWRRK